MSSRRFSNEILVSKRRAGFSTINWSWNSTLHTIPYIRNVGKLPISTSLPVWTKFRIIYRIWGWLDSQEFPAIYDFSASCNLFPKAEMRQREPTAIIISLWILLFKPTAILYESFCEPYLKDSAVVERNPMFTTLNDHAIEYIHLLCLIYSNCKKYIVFWVRI